MRQDLVQPLEPEGLLVRGDLKDAVDRGVADGLAGPQVLGPELVDDGGPGGVAVAEDAGEPRLAHERRDKLRRERRDGVREVAPGKRHGRPAISQWPDGVSLPIDVSTP
jgi:hypothetical protein